MSCCYGKEESVLDTETLVNTSKECTNKIVKITILGNCSVGKTTLINALTSKCPESIDQLVASYATATFGTTKCTIWDTAGQEKYRSITPIYLRNANICVICYSLTDSQSKADVHIWEELIVQYSPNATVLVVATKCDVNTSHCTNNDDDMVISSLTGEGIQELKDYLGETAILV